MLFEGRIETSDKSILEIQRCGLDTSREDHAGLLHHQMEWE
jgi:hypothetical protein